MGTARSASTYQTLLRARTWDRTTEARTGPGELYPRNGKRPPTIQRTCDDTASWPPRRPADGQQRAALRREGDGTRSQGLISPSRRMFSTAPVRGLSSWCLCVSLKSTSAHQCPACACGQKTTLRAPTWRSSRGTAPNSKTRPAAQRSGGHRRRRATWLPEEEQTTQCDELSGRRCYATATSGLHRSW